MEEEPPVCVMIFGRISQIPMVLAVLILSFFCNIVIGLLYLSQTYEDNELSSIFSIVGGIFGIMISVILYYAPFNLIKVLNETIDSLNQSNIDYKSLNKNHNAQIISLKEHNAHLADTVSCLDGKVKKMQLVENGLKTTSQNLLKLLADTNSNNVDASKITKSLELVAEDFDKSFTDNMSSFMKNLLTMDDLEIKLSDALDKNGSLNHQLEAAINSLKQIVDGQAQQKFNSKMIELVKWIDNKADGDKGIRKALESNQLTTMQYNDLLIFLKELDGLIDIHNNALSDKNNICSRHLSFQMFQGKRVSNA